MKILYKLPVVVNMNLKWNDHLQPVRVGQFEVSWDISEENLLQNILVSISEQNIEKDTEGKIDGIFPHLREELYKTVSYISNKIFTQTGVQVFTPSIVFSIAPDLIPENCEEEHDLKACPKKRAIQQQISWQIFNHLDLNGFSEDYAHLEAYSYIADANRVESPFLQFEQLFKVIEFFFGGTDQNFDRRVSAYTITLDRRFDQNKIETFRNLRNRCIHPTAHLGHANQIDLSAVNEIRRELPELRNLINMLISAPPAENEI